MNSRPSREHFYNTEYCARYFRRNITNDNVYGIRDIYINRRLRLTTADVISVTKYTYK